MKFVCALLLSIALLSVAPELGADTLVLKNGDRLTGTISESDGKQVTLKTDYAGEIKVQWAAVTDMTSEKALYVVTPEKKTVNGNVTVEGTDMIVHTASEGAVRMPLTSVTVVRSGDEQQAYEKSLHPGLLEDWKGGVNVGFALARGNSDTTNLSTGFTADRKTTFGRNQAVCFVDLFDQRRDEQRELRRRHRQRNPGRRAIRPQHYEEAVWIRERGFYSR